MSHLPRLAGILLLCAATTVAAERTERFLLKLDDGRELPAQLRVPAGAEGRLPVLILFGGFRRGDRVLDLVQPGRPLIRAGFDYPFEPPRKFTFPGSFLHAPEMRAAIHRTFEGIDKLHAALARRPDVDASRITIVGASAGAPFATVGAARNRIPGVILVQGFAEVPAVIQHLFERKHRAKYGDWIRWPASWLARWLHWYCEIPDIAAHARQLQPGQKVILFTAQDDDFVPRPASDALWTALGESGAARERAIRPGLHLRPDREHEVAEILRDSLSWMERHDLL